MTIDIFDVSVQGGVVDPTARGALAVRPPGFQGIQTFGERMEMQVTTGAAGSYTYELAMELPARTALSVGSLSLISGQSRALSNPSSPGCLASIGLVAAYADLDVALSLAPVTWPLVGNAVRLVTAQSWATYRREMQISDAIPVTGVVRTDGGARPLAVARFAIGAGSVALLGASGASLDAWATRAAGSARLRVNAAAADARTATAGWALTSTGPMIGFVYGHLGPIFNLMAVGDSRVGGQGAYISSNALTLAAESINAGNPRAWLSTANMGWSGCTSAAYVQNLKDALEAGIIPEVLVFEIGTPNDSGAASSLLTDAVVAGWRSATIQILELCAAYKIAPIAMTIYPLNYAARQYGTSDQKRVAYNVAMTAELRAVGVPVADVAPALAGNGGAVDGNGQQTLNPAYADDGVHANEAGKAIEAALLQPLLENILRGYL
jgi:lysophospholipase L1-like esterase